MSEAPADLKYTDTHEWVKMDGNVATVGITDHAQALLGDLVYVESPEVGTECENRNEVGVVESVKAASDYYAPVSGKIVEVNTDLEDQPELVNTDPYGEGWLFKVELSDQGELDDLVSADDYKTAIEE